METKRFKYRNSDKAYKKELAYSVNSLYIIEFYNYNYLPSIFYQDVETNQLYRDDMYQCVVRIFN